jgi:phosphoribosylformimino-5-aminoimidazole carboxamide ribotide isomerase
VDVIPAIDLRGGKCVRLYMGDYAKETVYDDDPVEVARRWHQQGARRLHVVDLDGALLGEPANLDVIANIVRAVNIPVQVGGGIRRIITAERLLQLGVARVIFGTIAVENPNLVAEACSCFGEAVVVSIDAQDGLVSIRGWKARSTMPVADLVNLMAEAGVKRFVYTDIARDGTLTEPNFEAVADLMKKTTLPIIVSGGVSSLEHIKRIKALGAEGAIVGKALYTGDLDLSKAIKAG